MTRLLICTAAALVIFGVPVSVRAAAPSANVKSINVAYRDLDLTREEGAHTLLRRLRAAADAACGPAPDIRDLSARSNYETCRQGALAKAVEDVHAPLVASLYGHQDPKGATSIVVADR